MNIIYRLRLNEFKKLFFLACLSACLYQIYTICDIYFSYKTTTFVNYDQFRVISLPAITVCFDKIDVLRDNVFNNTNQSETNYKDIRKKVMAIFQNYTIREQMQMLYNYSEIFYNCFVLKTKQFIDVTKMSNNNTNDEFYSEFYIPCQNISEIKQSINYFE